MLVKAVRDRIAWDAAYPDQFGEIGGRHQDFVHFDAEMVTNPAKQCWSRA